MTGRCACRCVSPGCKTCVQLNVNKEKRCGYGFTVGWASPKYRKSVERECSSSSSPVSRTLGLARRDNRMPLAAAARSRARWAAARTLRFTALSNIRISAPTTLAPWLCPPHHAAFAAAIAGAPGAAAAPCRARWRSTAARRGQAPRASPAAGRRARAPGARAPRWRCRPHADVLSSLFMAPRLLQP